MAEFVRYETVDDVEQFNKYTEAVAQHFGSDTMAEHYLNGFVNWDGSPTEESIRAEEELAAHFGY